MAKLLYITCDLRPEDQSYGLMAGAAFLGEYLKRNPRDEIHMLDLYRDSVQSADPDVLCALGKMSRGHHFATLTTVEQRKIDRMWALSGQFAAAGKYVVVTPLWKPGLPPELWGYLDSILVSGKTYQNTSCGPQGLLKGRERKCLLIHSAEGFAYGERELYCISNLRNALKFLGIEEFSSILVEGGKQTHEMDGDQIGFESEKVAAAALNF